MEIVKSLMTKNPCYTAGRTITVKGLMLHSVGCAQPSAEVFIKQWNSPSYDRACVHGFIDATSGKPEKKEERKGGKKNDEFLEGGDEPDDDFMNIPEGSPEYIEMLDPKTEKAIKKALRQYRDNDGDEDYIKECLLKMKKPYFSEQDGQAMLVEITEKL